MRAPWDPATVLAVSVLALVLAMWLGRVVAPSARAAADEVDTRAVDAPLSALRQRWLDEFAALRRLAQSMALADDTYEFARRPNFPFVDDHFSPDQVAALGVDTILILDRNARPLFWRRPRDPDNRGFPDAEAFLATLPPLPVPAARQTRGVPVLEGVVEFHGTPALVTAIAIEPAAGDGAPRGYLVYGRAIDAALTKRVLAATRAGVDVMPAGDALLPGQVRLRLEHSLAPVVVADEQQVHGYLPLLDLAGRLVRVYAVSAPRPAAAAAAPAPPTPQGSWSLVAIATLALLCAGAGGLWWTFARSRAPLPASRERIEKLARALADGAHAEPGPVPVSPAAPGTPHAMLAETLVRLGATAEEPPPPPWLAAPRAPGPTQAPDHDAARAVTVAIAPAAPPAPAVEAAAAVAPRESAPEATQDVPAVGGHDDEHEWLVGTPEALLDDSHAHGVAGVLGDFAATDAPATVDGDEEFEVDLAAPAPSETPAVAAVAAPAIDAVAVFEHEAYVHEDPVAVRDPAPDLPAPHVTAPLPTDADEPAARADELPVPATVERLPVEGRPDEAPNDAPAPREAAPESASAIEPTVPATVEAPLVERQPVEAAEEAPPAHELARESTFAEEPAAVTDEPPVLTAVESPPVERRTLEAADDAPAPRQIAEESAFAEAPATAADEPAVLAAEEMPSGDRKPAEAADEAPPPRVAPAAAAPAPSVPAGPPPTLRVPAPRAIPRREDAEISDVPSFLRPRLVPAAATPASAAPARAVRTRVFEVPAPPAPPTPPAAPSGDEAHRAIVRKLLDEGRLRVHYQPQVSTASGEIVGAEALIRWQDDASLLKAASALFGGAATADAFAGATEFVLRQACRDRRRWLDQVGRTLPVSVNVGLSELREDGFIARVLAILADERLPTACLELEVPERALASAASAEAQAIDAAYRHGIAVAVGGFVAADAPLHALTQVPVSKLKIHRALVADLPHDPHARAVVDTIIAVGRTLGVPVCAEGVQGAPQAAYLELRQCPVVQGWHYARAMDADQFLALIRGSGVDTVRLPLMDAEELAAHARAAGVA
jgi:EAL domain-containing protein (putative c-di-GMP-specific phosphodiesterase class I)/sensor domain CHASE-containing protein